LAAKVTLHAEPECDRIFPNQFPAILRVRTRGGAVHEEKVLANRGGPGNPLSAEELTVKFLGNARRALPVDRAEALARLILDPAERPVGEVLAAGAA
jgi:2-methylcitrate dehydratase PrpD